MSTVDRRILLQIQEDAYARILANDWLADVAVLLERKAVTEQEVKAQLTARNARAGKVGACILVQKPIISPEADNDSGRAQIVQAFTVIEHPMLNASDIGTGKSAEEIAVELFDLFQFAAASQPEQVFSGFPGGAIVPDDELSGFNAWEVRMRSYVVLRRTARSATPMITPEEGAAPAEITIEAAPGATIYYTTDDSAPYSGNAAAIVYSAPFTLPAGATVRASAKEPGKQPSSIAAAIFT